ncbi:FAD assembly factor SdhE [Sulfurisoma sediminicola]|uniref:FAD assembly factor SdhE n=1 Tax=Sulfurisoma sediminicola TaxID=1381557 RepID=A0A497XDD9_9PROT|nr:succinate dehydrogenase assembly factor 2 [Sulfurisoma sediminicola]RLJ65012.1 antitoxin CptB [Sulfurisoma sediminicola]
MDEARRVRIGRLRWHCRRALLELDIVFQRFWGEVGDDIDESTLDLMEGLLAEEDHDLWELVSGRRQSEDPAQQRLLARLQATPNLNTFATERH